MFQYNEKLKPLMSSKAAKLSPVLVAFAIALSPIGAEAKVVYKDNGKHINPADPKSNWVPFAMLSGPGVYESVKGGTKITTNHESPIAFGAGFNAYFTDAVQGPYLNLNQSFEPGPDEKISAVYKIKVEQFGTKNSAFGVSKNDPRLAVSGLAFVSADTGLTICFFQTSKAIYAFQDSFPGLTYPSGAYKDHWASGEKVAKVKKGSINKLKLQYDRGNNTMNWFVNGKKVKSHSEPGIIPASSTDVVSRMKTDPSGNPQVFEKYPDITGPWNIQIFGGLGFHTASSPGQGDPNGLVELGGPGSQNAPSSFSVPLATVQADPALYMQNKSASNPDGKRSELTLYKLKIKVKKSNNDDDSKSDDSNSND